MTPRAPWWARPVVLLARALVLTPALVAGAVWSMGGLPEGAGAAYGWFLFFGLPPVALVLTLGTWRARLHYRMTGGRVPLALALGGYVAAAGFDALLKGFAWRSLVVAASFAGLAALAGTALDASPRRPR